MASVERSVSGWLRSDDLLHTSLIVALLLGEFVSSSTLSLLAGILFPNSLVSLSFATILFLLLFILSILLSFYERFQYCTAVTVNLHFVESGPGPAPLLVIFSIVICRLTLTLMSPFMSFDSCSEAN